MLQMHQIVGPQVMSHFNRRDKIVSCWRHPVVERFQVKRYHRCMSGARTPSFERHVFQKLHIDRGHTSGKYAIGIFCYLQQEITTDDSLAGESRDHDE